jgi:hypothetical protein
MAMEGKADCILAFWPQSLKASIMQSVPKRTTKVSQNNQIDQSTSMMEEVWRYE